MVLYVLAGVLLAAEKPSPFAVKKSEAVVPVAPPVSPVVRAVRTPGAATPMVVAPAVSVPVSPVPTPKVVRPENRMVSAEVAAAPAAAAPHPEAEQERIKQTEPIVVEVEDKPPPIQDLRIGMAKDDLIAAMGKAATRIAMYDGADFIEVMRYEWKNRWVGSVRLSNGKVIKIDKPR